MNNNDRILARASKKCDGMNDSFIDFEYNFGLLYPFTTENIGGYIDMFDLSNKSLLTVGSSLDQTLNAILFDVSDVTVMDINPYTKYYYYLKLASIISLPCDEYLKFLRLKNYPASYMNNAKSLYIDVFNKIKNTLKSLDYDSYVFWNELIQDYGGYKVRTRIFSDDEYNTHMLRIINPYLNSEKNYQELKKKVQDTSVSFITGDIFSTKPGRYFDNIWLSNIGTYFESRLRLYRLLEKYKKYLNENGRLLLCYLYDTSDIERLNSDWSPVYDTDKVLEECPDLELKDFTGVRSMKGCVYRDKSSKDSVLLYRKKK